MKTRVVIYTRVSTKNQKTEPQLETLRDYAKQRGWGVVAEFSDKDHGDNDKRAGYKKLLDFTAKRKCDIVLVFKFDRFARNTRELLFQADELKARNVDFISYTENIDTTTPTGTLFFQITAAIKEFELNNIRERVKNGMDYARKHGTKSGKPIGRQPLESAQVRDVIRLYLDGELNPKQIQRRSGVSKVSYYKIVRATEAIKDDQPIDAVQKKWQISNVLLDQVRGAYRSLLISDKPPKRKKATA